MLNSALDENENSGKEVSEVAGVSASLQRRFAVLRHHHRSGPQAFTAQFRQGRQIHRRLATTGEMRVETNREESFRRAEAGIPDQAIRGGKERAARKKEIEESLIPLKTP